METERFADGLGMTLGEILGRLGAARSDNCAIDLDLPSPDGGVVKLRVEICVTERTEEDGQ